MNTYAVFTLLLGIVSIAHAGCPSRFSAKGGRCYRVLSAKKYAAQQSACANLRGFLAVPTAATINNNIKSMIRATTFIGINDMKREGVFVAGSTRKGLMYTNWNRGEPNDFRRAEDCGEMYTSGKWNDIFCATAVRQAVCEACQTGFKAYKGKCYKYVSTRVNNAQAQAACKNLGAHLAEPQNSRENNFIKRLIRGTSFIGFFDKAQEGQWVTGSSGCPAAYLSWACREPNNYHRNEHCSEMYTSGQWNDIFCHYKRGYVCEY